MVNLNDLNTPDVIIIISTVNPVAALIITAPENSRQFFLRAIRNKIIGIASDRLRLYGEPEAWTGIRTYLELHFSDHRDQRTLYNQLNSLRQTPR